VSAPRVAHLTTVDSSLWYLLRPQLRAVVERGGTVTGISAPGPCVPALAGDGVRHLALRSSTRGWSLTADLRAAAELWRILRRERFDVLHTHNPKPGVYGRIVGRLARVPLVVNTNHGLYISEGRRLRTALVLALEGLAARFSHVELVQNVEDMDRLTRWHLNSAKRTRLLGNGIDLERFRPPDDARRAGPGPRSARRPARAGGGAHGGPPRGREGLSRALRGRLQPGPGLRGGVRGPRRPVQGRRSVPGRGGGRGAGGRALPRPARRHRGPVPGADVFALPSHREGFPRAAMEAAASGLPVVATDVRGCRQVVDDGVTGALVPLRRPDALAEAVRALGEDPARRAKLGRAGRDKACREFDERAVVTRVLDAYGRYGDQLTLRE
jgi:glycosyltransferase involved in cell wall biosynthesis